MSEKISSMVEDLLVEKVIDKDSVDAARVCLAALMVGENKREARKIANARNFGRYWRNLKANGYFSKGKTVIEKNFDTISFIMMVLAAKGFIKVTRKKGDC